MAHFTPSIDRVDIPAWGDIKRPDHPDEYSPGRKGSWRGAIILVTYQNDNGARIAPDDPAAYTATTEREIYADGRDGLRHRYLYGNLRLCE